MTIDVPPCVPAALSRAAFRGELGAVEQSTPGFLAVTTALLAVFIAGVACYGLLRLLCERDEPCKER